MAGEHRTGWLEKCSAARSRGPRPALRRRRARCPSAPAGWPAGPTPRRRSRPSPMSARRMRQARRQPLRRGRLRQTGEDAVRGEPIVRGGLGGELAQGGAGGLTAGPDRPSSRPARAAASAPVRITRPTTRGASTTDVITTPSHAPLSAQTQPSPASYCASASAASTRSSTTIPGPLRRHFPTPPWQA